MKNNLEIFEHDTFGKLEVIMYQSKPHFYANDVAKSLGYTNERNAKNKCKSLIKLNMSETDMLGLKTNGNHGTSLIGESDLYRMIMGSKLPYAEKFQDWVVEEVLPSIRKHGGYTAGQEEMSAEELLAKAVLAAQSVIDEKNGIIREKDKIISDKNFPISLTKIFSNNNKLAQAANLWLEDQGYIEKSFERGVKKGWFLTKEGEAIGYGSQVSKHSIFWTPDVLKFLPSTKKLLEFAESLDLVNYKRLEK